MTKKNSPKTVARAKPKSSSRAKRKDDGLVLPSLDLYLYCGFTIQQIITQYVHDLRVYGKTTNDRVELFHAQFLERYLGIVTNASFIEAIQEDLEKKFLTEVIYNHSSCCFALRGRLKSLIRLENKFNSYVQDFIISHIEKTNKRPTVSMILKHLERLQDTLAYRFILQGKDCSPEEELKHLVSIANSIPDYFSSESMEPNSIGGYTLLKAVKLRETSSNNESMLAHKVRPYYKDYISNPKLNGFRAFTICMRHTMSQQDFELQLMTFDMFKHNEHSKDSAHSVYEERQTAQFLNAKLPPRSTFNKIYNHAHNRLIQMSRVDYTSIDVKLFHAFSQSEIEDFCGLVIGRQATPVWSISFDLDSNPKM